MTEYLDMFLFEVLRRLGCGSIMLCALVAMYKITESWIGSALVMVSLGVKQGFQSRVYFFLY